MSRGREVSMGRRSTRRHRASISADVARIRRLTTSLEPQRYFTQEQALAALAFLRPVIEDLQAAFRIAVDCHRRLRIAVLSEQVKTLQARQAQAIERFDRAIDEVELVGGELLDCWTGAVAFPTGNGADRVHLIWSPNDEHQWRSATLAQFARDQRQSMINRC